MSNECRGPGRYSDRSIVRQVVSPTGRYSDKQVHIPTGLYSDRSIFRQVVIPTGRYPDVNLIAKEMACRGE